YQSVLFAVMTKIFAISQALLPHDRRMTRLFEIVNLERGLIAGALLMLVGMVLLAVAVAEWYGRHFGNLDYERTMRWVIPGATLTALGFQTVLSSFFFSILGLRRR
ncbi:MAG: glycosyltransferase family 2 protein, partial [Gemmatimonadaceae bacterium]